MNDFPWTEDAARALLGAALNATGGGEAEATLGGGSLALTRFANNRIHQNVREEWPVLGLRVLLRGPDGVRVNAICPGHIVTERTRDEWEGNPNAQQLIVDQYPVRKIGWPDDIANAVSFLCSDEASFITGHPLVVDGGLSIQLQENLGVRQAALARSMPELEIPGPEHA